MQGHKDHGLSSLKLARFLQPRTQRPLGERCEFCAAEIAAPHSHVVNIETRALWCACRPCSLLFSSAGAAQGKYRAVPDRYVATGVPVFTAAQWDSLQLPVSIAFFFFNSILNRTVAFYPSPAGATESLLPLDTWHEVVHAHPLLTTLLPDVEALLVYKHRTDCECYVVPIDACYELVGRLRRHWKGFDGGEDAWREIDTFFARVRAQAAISAHATLRRAT